MSKPDTPERKVSASISRDDERLLQALVDARQVSRATIVREALVRYLDHIVYLGRPITLTVRDASVRRPARYEEP